MKKMNLSLLFIISTAIVNAHDGCCGDDTVEIIEQEAKAEQPEKVKNDNLPVTTEEEKKQDTSEVTTDAVTKTEIE